MVDGVRPGLLAVRGSSEDRTTLRFCVTGYPVRRDETRYDIPEVYFMLLIITRYKIIRAHDGCV